MQKTLFTLISVLLTAACVGAQTTFTADKLICTVTDESGNTVEITGYESGLAGKVDIPDKLTHENRTYSVTGIGKEAFLFCTELTEITIPDNVTTIRAWAFQSCKALTTINMGSGITSVGEFAFEDCTALKQINVDADNTAFCSENGVLFNKDKTALIGYPAAKAETVYTVPEGVTDIRQNACSFCAALTQVILPGSLTDIGDFAFSDCTALTEITVRAAVPPAVVSGNAFYNVNRGIPVYVPAEAVEAYKAADVWKEFNNLQTEVLPEGITQQGGMPQKTAPDHSERTTHHCKAVAGVFPITENQWR